MRSLHRFVPVVVLAVALTGTACSTAAETAKSAAEDVVDQATAKLQCSTANAVAEALPAGDTFDEATIAKLSEGAKTLQKAISNMPADQLPAGAKAKIDQVLADASNASSQYKANPEMAKEMAASALDSLRNVISNLRSTLGC